jgi:hypothetical protein
MARITFDDDVESKKEFWKLLPLVGGNRLVALGLLVVFFRLAQQAYGHRRVLTRDELLEAELECMIESGWAIPEGDGFMAKGAESRFGWYRQKVDAGKSRGLAERDEHGHFLPNDPAAHQRLTSGSQRNSIPHQPLVLAPAPAKKNKEHSVGREVATRPPPSEPSGAGQFIATYVKAWQQRFGEKTRPALHGRTQGQIKALLKSVPLERACELIQVYFQMDEPWFKTKGYDFGSFIENLDKVGLALDTGQSQPGGINWAKVFGDEAKP